MLFACVRAFNDGANEYYSIKEMFSFKSDCFVLGFGCHLNCSTTNYENERAKSRTFPIIYMGKMNCSSVSMCKPLSTHEKISNFDSCHI